MLDYPHGMNPTLERALRLVVLAAALVGAGCDNACDFWQRCQGDVLQTCGQGVDQTFHRRVHELPCEEPNGACVETGPRTAACVRAPPEPCDAAFRARCEGTLRIYCAPGGARRFVAAVDCAAADPAGRCEMDPSAGGICVL
jgi:hypothetical protein